jgi:hypothetical protein
MEGWLRGRVWMRFGYDLGAASGAGGEGDAGDVGVVVEEAQIVPGGEECAQGLALIEAEFEGEQAAGAERDEGLGDEAAVDVEACGAGEKGDVGFVVDDLGLHGGGVGEGDVGGVGDDDVEGRVGVEFAEQIGLYEVDAVGEVESFGVVARYGESGGGDVGCGDAGGGEMRGEGEGYGSGAGADVEYAERGRCGWLRGDGVEDGFDEELGFGAGDEGVGGDAEGEAVEVLYAGEVLERLVGGSAEDEGVEGCEVVRAELGAGVGEEPGAIVGEEVGEEGLGVAAGDVGGGLVEGFAESHKAVSSE